MKPFLPPIFISLLVDGTKKEENIVYTFTSPTAKGRYKNRRERGISNAAPYHKHFIFIYFVCISTFLRSWIFHTQFRKLSLCIDQRKITFCHFAFAFFFQLSLYYHLVPRYRLRRCVHTISLFFPSPLIWAKGNPETVAETGRYTFTHADESEILYHFYGFSMLLLM